MGYKKTGKARAETPEEVVASGRAKPGARLVPIPDDAIKRPRKVYECGACGKLFLRTDKLKAHSRRHAKEYLTRQKTIDVIADNLTLLLEMRKWSQADLARAIGVTAATVNGWVKRKHPPSVNYYMRLSEISTKLFPHLISARGPELTTTPTAKWRPPEEWEDNVRDQLSAEIAKLRKLITKKGDVIVPREIYSLWMGRGDAMPTVRTLVKIGRVAGLRPSEFLRRCGL